jgi:isopentenyldiphosphate isomerase
MEMFQLVDANGKPAGSAGRDECHGNPALVHLVVHLHVLDPAGRLYLQKRALSKDTNPGKWDAAVGGHVMAGESVEHALLREAGEELGIDASGARRIYDLLYRSLFESEYAACFLIVHGGEIHPNSEEIEEGRFFTMEEIQGLMGKGVLTPMFEKEFPMLRQRL